MSAKKGKGKGELTSLFSLFSSVWRGPSSAPPNPAGIASGDMIGCLVTLRNARDTRVSPTAIQPYSPTRYYVIGLRSSPILTDQRPTRIESKIHVESMRRKEVEYFIDKL